MNVSVAEIAECVGGVVSGDDAVRITGFSGMREARPGDLTFLADPRYEKYLAETRASAIIAVEGTVADIPVIVVESPYHALMQAVVTYTPPVPEPPKEIHPTAVVAEDAVLADDISIGPQVVIESGVTLESGVAIGAGSYLGHRSHIGSGTVIHPRVTVYAGTRMGARCVIHSGAVIGADGFGFAEQDGARMKIPQLGTVVLGDDVEVGSNTCIDRATFGVTRIGNGVKIDNLVQIGHNTAIDDDSVICGNAGIAGSTIIGKRVVIGAAAGINGHVTIGDGAMVGGFSGVTGSLKPGSIVFGYPAVDIRESHRIHAAQRRLPKALKRLRNVERRLDELEGAKG